MIAIGKYIIIETIEKEVTTESGLLLSAHDANDFRYKMGVVVAPGTDVANIKAGDNIYYDKAGSYTMVIKDKPYTIIQARDVVVVA